MAVFKCKMCGGALNIEGDSPIAECEYCGSKQTIPSADNERKMALFDRAERLRRKCEFSKAESVYETIVSEFPSEPEGYWGVCLCKYGIEYVDDPATLKKIPTCHRTAYESIFKDENFDLALEYADPVAVSVYREEAKEIDRLQKAILEIAQNESPYDIFICYKETDDLGNRTKDSVRGQEIYQELIKQGYKVFFSRISLEDKLGTDYEPYIFAALNSAKIMLAIGTSYDNYNAVWVKNEWGRFLKLMEKDPSKKLIPCYEDVDAYDIPDEFSRLQGQDMSKLGFLQDLIRGINKITGANSPAAAVETSASESAATSCEALLKRGFMFCEDRDWETADEYFEKVLDIDPENALAYLGKLMAKLRAKKIEDLKERSEPFNDYSIYEKIKRFGSDELLSELDEYSKIVLANKEKRIAEEKAQAERERIEKARLAAEEKKRQEEARKNAAKRFVEEIGSKTPGQTIGFAGMKWFILRREYNLSMLILQEQKKKSVRWNGWVYSPIRKWLNTDFLNNNFQEKEREMILNVKQGKGPDLVDDKVFLLSSLELSRALAAIKKIYGLRQLDVSELWERHGTECLVKSFGGFVSSEVKSERAAYWVQPVIWVNSAVGEDPMVAWKKAIEQDAREVTVQIENLAKQIKVEKREKLVMEKKQLEKRYKKLTKKMKHNFDFLWD